MVTDEMLALLRREVAKRTDSLARQLIRGMPPHAQDFNRIQDGWENIKCSMNSRWGLTGYVELFAKWSQSLFASSLFSYVPKVTYRSPFGCAAGEGLNVVSIPPPPKIPSFNTL